MLDDSVKCGETSKLTVCLSLWELCLSGVFHARLLPVTQLTAKFPAPLTPPFGTVSNPLKKTIPSIRSVEHTAGDEINASMGTAGDGKACCAPHEGQNGPYLATLRRVTFLFASSSCQRMSIRAHENYPANDYFRHRGHGWGPSYRRGFSRLHLRMGVFPSDELLFVQDPFQAPLALDTDKEGAKAPRSVLS